MLLPARNCQEANAEGFRSIGTAEYWAILVANIFFASFASPLCPFAAPTLYLHEMMRHAARRQRLDFTAESRQVIFTSGWRKALKR